LLRLCRESTAPAAMTPPSSILARLALLLVAMLALFGPAGALPQPCRRRCRFPLPAFSSPSTHTGRPGEHECARERAGAPRPAGRLTDCFVQCAAAADPCLEGDYAVENYGTCCAHGGYKIEGHKEVCRLAKAKLVKSAPHARAPLAAAAACRRCLPAWPTHAVCLNLAVCLTPCLRAFCLCEQSGKTLGSRKASDPAACCCGVEWLRHRPTKRHVHPPPTATQPR
jgi:hypothetical protein